LFICIDLYVKDEAGFKSIVNSTQLKLIVCGIDTVEKVRIKMPKID